MITFNYNARNSFTAIPKCEPNIQSSLESLHSRDLFRIDEDVLPLASLLAMLLILMAVRGGVDGFASN